jgi:hypothetical protein
MSICRTKICTVFGHPSFIYPAAGVQTTDIPRKGGLMGVSSKICLAQSGINRQVSLKGRGTENSS